MQTPPVPTPLVSVVIPAYNAANRNYEKQDVDYKSTLCLFPSASTSQVVPYPFDSPLKGFFAPIHRYLTFLQYLRQIKECQRLLIAGGHEYVHIAVNIDTLGAAF